ncbi:DUF4190 domain-containing protein [Planotetraspora phitsanulokensis]|uniref:DUF4190 domain-containing protein n=1 Tax=Planotetraspora phitsanulokensis TaxID=575192 RepID=A0A8J3UBK3_9ACTN|nr:DUF4190 domain-containing protein [Planotetraspora phitsanulokensis]GII42418.1 hypothetical protein Pph01_74210 [Planotetraspora phitsanulokensis]
MERSVVTERPDQPEVQPDAPGYVYLYWPGQHMYTPYGQPYVHHPAIPHRRTNGLAITTLILGLTGFITCGVTSILAAVLGLVALGQIRRDHTGGRGMALAGTVLGWVFTVLWIIYWVWVSVVLAQAPVSPSTGPTRPRPWPALTL